MAQNKQKDYKIISLFLVITLFVLLPFIYNPKLQDPELTLRFLVFSGLLSVLFIVLLAIKTPAFSSVTGDFLANKYIISFTLFLLIAGISLLRSFDVVAGMYDLLRVTLMFLFLLVFTFLLKNNYVKKEHLITGAAIAVLLFSLFEVRYVLPDMLNTIAKRRHFQIKYWYGSTLANKNLYCETLFMFLPFLADGILSFSGLRKYLCLTSFFIALITIFFLQSASPIFTVGITFILLIITLYRFKINILPFFLSKRIKAALIAVAAIAIIGGVALFIYTKNYDVLKVKFSSLAQFLSEKDSAEHSNKAYGSFSERILLWKHTFKMIKDYPLFGCGLSNWKTLLPHYGVFGIGFMDAGTLKFEHPHNDYLLIAAETGLTGLIAYLLIFFFLLKQAFRNFRKSVYDRKEALRSLFIFYGIIGFMILSLFEFPKERFYPFLMLMMLFAMVIKNTPEENTKSKTSFAFTNKLFLILCLIISGYSSWFFYKRYNGEQHFSKAIQFQGRKDWTEMKNETILAKSAAYQSDRLAIPLDWYTGFACFYSGDVTSAQPFFESALQLNPYFIQGWNDLGTCYEQAKNFPGAISCYKKALSINPTFNNTLLNLIAVYYNTGQRDTAYQLITTFPIESSNPQYKSYLTTIIGNKLNNDFSTIINKPGNEALEKKVKNDGYLLNLFYQSKKININIDSLFYKELKK